MPVFECYRVCIGMDRKARCFRSLPNPFKREEHSRKVAETESSDLLFVDVPASAPLMHNIMY